MKITDVQMQLSMRARANGTHWLRWQSLLKEGNKTTTATGMELDAITMQAKELLGKANIQLHPSLPEADEIIKGLTMQLNA